MDNYAAMIQEMTDAIQMFERMDQEGTLLNKNELTNSYAVRGSLYAHFNQHVEAVKDLDSAIMTMKSMTDAGQQVDVNGLADVYIARGANFAIMGGNYSVVQKTPK